MTGSKVLVVKLPERLADVKQLEAFRAYVCDALGAGALVLPSGTTYAVEDFPALGAVEVVAGDAVPVVIGGPRLPRKRRSLSRMRQPSRRRF